MSMEGAKIMSGTHGCSQGMQHSTFGVIAFLSSVLYHLKTNEHFVTLGDVQTIPTAEMLKAVTYASMGNDVSRSDASTTALEEYLASMTSHEAALFVLSATMGNVLAVRTLLTQPPYGVLCDARAHCLTTEAGGAFAFTGAVAQPVEASNGQHLTLEDVMPHVKINSNNSLHIVPTRVIVLENTLRGMIMPLNEARRICDFAHKNDIKVHLDGARLWEAVVAGAESVGEHLSLLREYCSLVDTATLCFSKGLGAPVGGILVGKETDIHQARWLRQSIGGGVRQPGLLTACAYTAVKRTFECGLLKRTHEIARELGRFWKEGCGGRLLYPIQTNMVWLDLSNQRFTLEDLIARAEGKGIYITRERLVVHYRKY